MSNRKALIAKIKKCLALASSANQHEAALALEKAQALMAEHGISPDDIQLSDVEFAQAKGSGARRPARWETMLADAIATAAQCKIVYEVKAQGWKWSCLWNFYGITPNAEIAVYAWSVLYRQLRRQRQEYISTALRRCKPARKIARADVFCEAWAGAVQHKVRNLVPDPIAHALIERYIEQNAGALEKLKSRDASSNLTGALGNDYMHGAAAGRAASLHAGVGAEAQKRLS